MGQLSHSHLVRVHGLSVLKRKSDKTSIPTCLPFFGHTFNLKCTTLYKVTQEANKSQGCLYFRRYHGGRMGEIWAS